MLPNQQSYYSALMPHDVGCTCILENPGPDGHHQSLWTAPRFKFCIPFRLMRRCPHLALPPASQHCRVIEVHFCWSSHLSLFVSTLPCPGPAPHVANFVSGQLFGPASPSERSHHQGALNACALGCRTKPCPRQMAVPTSSCKQTATWPSTAPRWHACSGNCMHQQYSPPQHMGQCPAPSPWSCSRYVAPCMLRLACA